MKKIIFIALLPFFLANFASAQEATWMDSATCTAGGGECNLHFDTCETNQTAIGRCDNWGPDDGACCKMKDNGSVDLSNHGVDMANALVTGTVPIIGQTKCESPKASGGWGGACKGSCNDSGNDEEDFVGLCTPPGMVGSGENCCVAKGTAIKNPTPDHYETVGMTEAVCESTYAGKCEDIDSTGWDPTGGFLDGKDPTCDTEGEVVVGLCQSPRVLGVGGDFDNGCCVPREGAYCKKLESTKGYDVCGTMGTGGLAESITYGDYELLEQIPGSSNTSGQLKPYLESLYKAGFVLIVIGAILMIGFGGFTYMASAGNTSMIKKGKGMITDAIIGLVVALLIWLILNIINPDLVNLSIDPLPGVSFDPGGSGANIAAGGTGDRCTAIPEANLTTIDGFQMLKSTGSNFLAMKEAAKSAGITLELRSGYRSPQRQKEIWDQYGCKLQSGKAVCTGGKSVAIPCSLGGGGSNHSTGEAIDINVGCGNGTAGCNTKIYNWLKINGAKYNFYNNLPKDPPHWSATGK